MQINLTWDDIANDTQTLASKINLQPFYQHKPKTIIGIARGGLIPATMLAKLLDIKIIIPFGINTYDNAAEQHGFLPEPDVYQPLSEDFSPTDGAPVLVVDDLVDTGRTFSELMRRKYHMDNEFDVISATLYSKPRSNYTPHLTVREYPDDTWLTFPWETLKC